MESWYVYVRFLPMYDVWYPWCSSCYGKMCKTGEKESGRAFRSSTFFGKLCCVQVYAGTDCLPSTGPGSSGPDGFPKCGTSGRGDPARSEGETFPETLIRESCGRRCIRISRCSYRQSARYFFRSSGSASIPMKTPPTTERAWKPTCLPSSVSYQSQSGTRVGVSSSQV